MFFLVQKSIFIFDFCIVFLLFLMKKKRVEELNLIYLIQIIQQLLQNVYSK